MKEDGNERLRSMEAEDKGAATHGRHGGRVLKPATMSAIQLKRDVMGL